VNFGTVLQRCWLVRCDLHAVFVRALRGPSVDDADRKVSGYRNSCMPPRAGRVLQHNVSSFTASNSILTRLQVDGRNVLAALPNRNLHRTFAIRAVPSAKRRSRKKPTGLALLGAMPGWSIGRPSAKHQPWVRMVGLVTYVL
jgi:hypothetical protein